MVLSSIGAIDEKRIVSDPFGPDDADASLQGNDWLDGGAGDDRLEGNAGDDVLIGGSGANILNGGAGRDTYIVSNLSNNRIYDPDKDSVIVFGEGLASTNLKLRKGSLLLDFGGNTELHIDNFDSADPLAHPSVATFQFADGQSLTWDGLLARGFDLDGTEGDDEIVGTGVVDRISGFGGSDVLIGLDGNDILDGGTGTDGMNGGLGDDTYVFRAGDGATSDGTSAGVTENLADDGGTDTVRFEASVDPHALRFAADPLGLVVDYNAAGQPLDRLLIEGGLTGAIERFTVTDGADLMSFDGGSLTVTLAAGEDHVALALLTQGDVDANRSLGFTATLNDGGTPLASVQANVALTATVEAGPANTLHIDGVDLQESALNPSRDRSLFNPHSTNSYRLAYINVDLNIEWRVAA